MSASAHVGRPPLFLLSGKENYRGHRHRRGTMNGSRFAFTHKTNITYVNIRRRCLLITDVCHAGVRFSFCWHRRKWANPIICLSLRSQLKVALYQEVFLPIYIREAWEYYTEYCYVLLACGCVYFKSSQVTQFTISTTYHTLWLVWGDWCLFEQHTYFTGEHIVTAALLARLHLTLVPFTGMPTHTSDKNMTAGKKKNRWSFIIYTEQSAFECIHMQKKKNV